MANELNQELVPVVKKWVVAQELGERLASYFDGAKTEILESKEKTSKVVLTHESGTAVEMWVPTSQIIYVPSDLK